MPHHQAFKFKSAATQIVGTLVVIFAAGIFLYASHTTVASYANAAKSVASENALPELPAASGMNGVSALSW
jgi:hypothetical protein